MKEISVNEAIRIGKRNVSLRFTVPLYLTLIMACLSSLLISMPFYYILISFPAGILFSLYFTTRYLYQWQAWAFQHVRNVHELKVKAKKWGLIPGWESKLFPPSVRERFILERLREKFSQPDVLPDNSHIPKVFEIYYCRGYNRIELIGWFLGFIGMTWLIIALIKQGEFQTNLMMQIIFGTVWITTLIFSVENFIQLRTTQPAITLTQDGIWIKRRFFKKDDIKDIEVYYDNHKMLNLKFYVTKITYQIDTTDMDVAMDTLEDITEVFVRRWRA